MRAGPGAGHDQGELAGENSWGAEAGRGRGRREGPGRRPEGGEREAAPPSGSAGDHGPGGSASESRVGGRGRRRAALREAGPPSGRSLPNMAEEPGAHRSAAARRPAPQEL